MGTGVPGAAIREGSTGPGTLTDETGRDYTYPTTLSTRLPQAKPFLPLHGQGWEGAPSCSGNAADHFPFPLSAPA